MSFIILQLPEVAGCMLQGHHYFTYFAKNNSNNKSDISIALARLFFLRLAQRAMGYEATSEKKRINSSKGHGPWFCKNQGLMPGIARQARWQGLIVVPHSLANWSMSETLSPCQEQWMLYSRFRSFPL